uniref:Uncharacterized protein n=1 Tax=Castor canadensis TaxID=51338 RepID=A0A8C0XHW8_CASCN
MNNKTIKKKEMVLIELKAWLKLGFPRAHLPIVYLRYILHVFYYMINNMLALTIFILFSFCLNLFCLALG